MHTFDRSMASQTLIGDRPVSALEADDLVRQLNGPVGGPPLWFAAIFGPS